jgi:hypothetical protein
MTIRILREPTLNETTLGVVMVDGVFRCFSLEDAVREVKVPGETAIPAGRYRVALTHSPKFGRVLPEVLDVPGFTGVRLHPGNSNADTDGCVLLGYQRKGAFIEQSRLACDKVQEQISAAAARGEQCWLLIENALGS